MPESCKLKVVGYKSGLFSVLIILFFHFKSFSQEVNVAAQLDTNSILIGAQTKLHLSVTYKADQGDINIQWPEIADTIIKQIEVVSKSKIDTTIPDKVNPHVLMQSQTLVITSFDSGFHAIPPFRFIVNNDSNNITETEAMLFQVNTLTVDTAMAIKDIKPPIEEPFNFKELMPLMAWGAGILAILSLIIFLIIKYVKKKKHKPVIKDAPKRPSHIIALEELEKLKSEKLWQEGKIKLYYSRLSEIIRTYIEYRFKINALEQTTDEIVYHFRTAIIDDESKEKLKQILTLADLVKFAKEQPIASVNEMIMSRAMEFVNGTKREEVKDKNEIAVTADV